MKENEDLWLGPLGIILAVIVIVVTVWLQHGGA